jgi:hypothetical protein
MLCRYLAVTTVLLVVVVGARFNPHAADRRERPIFMAEQPSTMTGTDRERYEQLVDLRARRDEYSKIDDLLTKELARGAINLREATERMFYYCIQNYPEHLEYVSVAETGQNIKTRLARNFLGGFQTAQNDGAKSGIDEIVVRLDRELRELPYEEESADRLEAQ